MDTVNFMEIEEDEKDLIISFALYDGDGDIRSLILHRTLFYEFIMPDEERGTKVSLEGDYLVLGRKLHFLQKNILLCRDKACHFTSRQLFPPSRYAVN